MKFFFFGMALSLVLVLFPACGKSQQSKLLSTTGAVVVGTDPDGHTLLEVDYCSRPPTDQAGWYQGMLARTNQYLFQGIPLAYLMADQVGNCNACLGGDYNRCAQCKRGELDDQMFNPPSTNAHKSAGTYLDAFCIDARPTGTFNGVPTGFELTGNYWARKTIRL